MSNSEYPSSVNIRHPLRSNCLPAPFPALANPTEIFLRIAKSPTEGAPAHRQLDAIGIFAYARAVNGTHCLAIKSKLWPLAHFRMMKCNSVLVPILAAALMGCKQPKNAVAPVGDTGSPPAGGAVKTFRSWGISSPEGLLPYVASTAGFDPSFVRFNELSADGGIRRALVFVFRSGDDDLPVEVFIDEFESAGTKRTPVSRAVAEEEIRKIIKAIERHGLIDQYNYYYNGGYNHGQYDVEMGGDESAASDANPYGDLTQKEWNRRAVANVNNATVQDAGMCFAAFFSRQAAGNRRPPGRKRNRLKHEPGTHGGYRGSR